MNEFQLKVQTDLENCLAILRNLSSGDCDDFYYECCGRVWAYRHLDLIKFETALSWIDRFALAAEGKCEEAIT